MAQKVLLVIDMINDFMNPRGALYCGDEARRIVPVIRSLLDRFSRDNQPIVYLRDAHAENDREFQLFARHAVKGSWGSRVIPELEPPPGSSLVDKTRFSAFYKTDLGKILTALQPDEVWVTGVVTSICVMDTVGDLVNRDHSVVIPVDAVADFDMEFHEFALKRMERVYGAKLVHGDARLE